MDAGFEVITAVTMESTVFWVVMPCSSHRPRSFGGTYLLHLQGRRICQTKKDGRSMRQAFSDLHGVTAPETVFFIVMDIYGRHYSKHLKPATINFLIPFRLTTFH
jgi:hypothetical protein